MQNTKKIKCRNKFLTPDPINIIKNLGQHLDRILSRRRIRCLVRYFLLSLSRLRLENSLTWVGLAKPTQIHQFVPHVFPVLYRTIHSGSLFAIHKLIKQPFESILKLSDNQIFNFINNNFYTLYLQILQPYQ